MKEQDTTSFETIAGVLNVFDNEDMAIKLYQSLHPDRQEDFLKWVEVEFPDSTMYDFFNALNN